MSKGYWVVRASISNQDEYSKYIKKASKVVESFNGRFLVRGGKQNEYENIGYERTVVVQFNSYEDAIKAYKCSNYQDALMHVKKSAERLFTIVKGV